MTAEEIAAMEAANLPILPDDPGVVDPNAQFLLPDDIGAEDAYMPDEGEGYGQGDIDTSAAIPPLPTRITSQEQFDALPEWQKDIIRMQAQGIRVSHATAAKYAMDAMKAQRESYQPKLVTVEDPNSGQKVTAFMTSKNSAQALLNRPTAKFQTEVRDDNTLMLVDMQTGRSFPAWDYKTGQPWKVRDRGRAPQLDDRAKLQVQVLDNKLAQLNNRIADLTGKVAAGETSFWGKPYDSALAAAQAERDELVRQRAEILSRASLEVTNEPAPAANPAAAAATPPPTPTPTPTPTPPPTPTPAPTPAPSPTPSRTPEPQPTPTEQTMTVAEVRAAGYDLPPGSYRDANGNRLIVTP